MKVGFGGKGSRQQMLVGQGQRTSLTPGSPEARAAGQYGKGFAFPPPAPPVDPAPTVVPNPQTTAEPSAHPGANVVRGSNP